MKLVLMPGMDGTGDLFAPFIEAAPPEFELLPRYPEAGPFAILAESFSGPGAIEYAARNPERVLALVLCNSFASPPVPRFVRRLPFVRPPRFAIRVFLTGSRVMVDEVRATIAKVPRSVMRARIDEVTRVNVLAALRAVRCPILDLRGAGDRLIPRRCIEEIAPFASQRVIPGPHLLLQVEPREAWREIAPFLSTRAAAAPVRS